MLGFCLVVDFLLFVPDVLLCCFVLLFANVQLWLHKVVGCYDVFATEVLTCTRESVFLS